MAASTSLSSSITTFKSSPYQPRASSVNPLPSIKFPSISSNNLLISHSVQTLKSYTVAPLCAATVSIFLVKTLEPKTTISSAFRDTVTSTHSFGIVVPLSFSNLQNPANMHRQSLGSSGLKLHLAHGVIIVGDMDESAVVTAAESHKKIMMKDQDSSSSLSLTPVPRLSLVHLSFLAKSCRSNNQTPPDPTPVTLSLRSLQQPSTPSVSSKHDQLPAQNASLKERLGDGLAEQKSIRRISRSLHLKKTEEI